MAKKDETVHRILKKLIEELSDFKSDDEIRVIAIRICGHDISISLVKTVRLSMAHAKGKHQPYKARNQRGCLDLYDHRKIREFLDEHKKKPKVK